VIAVNSHFPGMLGFVGAAVVGIVLIAAWVILAGSRFVQGGVVERPERVPQLYGYTVCLVSLFWAITSAIAVVSSVLTLRTPEYRSSEFGPMEPSVTSFEAFRSTYEQSRRFMSPDPREKVDTVPEPELRRRYEGLRADRIQRNTVEAQRSIITSGISLVIALALFVLHWRWLRRSGGPPMFAGTTRTDV
jgi:hypothetical protein